jgi:hypothetical protein
MARLGVASLPIALFIAAFTGIVMALQASYTLTGAVPLYFVGVLVGKTMILELGPGADGAGAGRPGRREHRRGDRHHARDGADRRARDARLRPVRVPRRAARARRHLMFPSSSRSPTPSASWRLGHARNLLDMSTPEFVRGLRLFFSRSTSRSR